MNGFQGLINPSSVQGVSNTSNMEKTSKQEIEKACQELKDALFQAVELDEKLTNLKILQTKAQKRLSLARDAVHFIRIT